MVLALKATLATPEALVVTVMVVLPLLKVPLAPLVGAVKVTLIPTTGLPFASVTFAWRGVVKATPTVADCGVPAVELMAAGTRVLVRLKEAGVATAGTLAVTL